MNQSWVRFRAPSRSLRRTDLLKPGPLKTFGFAGQYTDTETGLQYLRARYYDPGTGVFITRDPLEAITSSPYGYVNGNPLNATDPLGLWGWSNITKFVGDHGTGIAQIGAVVAGAGLVIGTGGTALLVGGITYGTAGIAAGAAGVAIGAVGTAGECSRAVDAGCVIDAVATVAGGAGVAGAFAARAGGALASGALAELAQPLEMFTSNAGLGVFSGGLGLGSLFSSGGSKGGCPSPSSSPPGGPLNGTGIQGAPNGFYDAGTPMRP